VNIVNVITDLYVSEYINRKHRTANVITLKCWLSKINSVNLLIQVFSNAYNT